MLSRLQSAHARPPTRASRTHTRAHTHARAHAHAHVHAPARATRDWLEEHCVTYTFVGDELLINPAFRSR